MKCINVIVGLASISLLSCSEKSASPERETFPMEAFSLKVGNYVYHASIDQERHVARIGVIEYGSYVTGVDCRLAEGASISPSPKEFVGKWPQSQQFDVTLSDGSVVPYVVTLSSYVAERPEITGEVIFEDDFNQAEVRPNPEKWTFCYPGTADWAKWMSPSLDQAYVKDGKLILKAEGSSGSYKGGGVTTQNKFWCRNARVEVCAKMSEMAQGTWQAIWMMPQNAVYPGWPGGGEIDIMEHLNHETFFYQTVHSHYIDNLHNYSPSAQGRPEFNVSEFNIYGVDITDDALVFHVNGRETFRYPNLRLGDEDVQKQWPFGGEFYLMINFALGGAGTWPGVIADGELPVLMEVDWVKVTALGTDLQP